MTQAAQPSESLVAQCRRSNRFWHSWLERGDSSQKEAEAVFTDATLRSRLSAPLQRFKQQASGGSSVLGAITSTGVSGNDSFPEAAGKLAKHVEDAFGITADAAKDLVRLYADEKLSGFAVIHHQGSVYDLLDLSVERPSVERSGRTTPVDELERLWHAEKCEALNVVACVLRIAHDDGPDGHPYSDQCKLEAHSLLTGGLSEHLWRLFEEYDVCRQPGSNASYSNVFGSALVSREEVVAYFRQGLELQLRVLECLAHAHYNPELYAPTAEQLCRMAELILRQRFLGSLWSAAAGPKAPYECLLDDSQICVLARCVGDLSLVLLLEAFGLEDDPARMSDHGSHAAHPLLKEPQHLRRLHSSFNSDWVRRCEVAANGHALINSHCAQMSSLAILGWAALIGSVPGFAEAHGLGLQKIMACPVFTSPNLVEDAANNILNRGFLAKDAPLRDHGVFRKVLRHLAGAVASSFKLEKAVPGILVAMSRLMEAAYKGEADMSKDFWTLDCPHRRGGYFVLRAWLNGFPGSLGKLLDFIGGLAGTQEHPEAAVTAVNLLQAPLQKLLLPHNIVPVQQRASPSASPSEVALLHPVYLEELALRSLGIVLPEWHVPLCKVLGPESDIDIYLVDATLEGPASGFTRNRKVCWDLRGKDHTGRGLSSVWRLALAIWDASLEALGCVCVPTIPGMLEPSRSAPSVDTEPVYTQLLLSVLRCVCNLLIASPATYADLCRGLPSDRPFTSSSSQDEAGPSNDGSGLLARLLASLHACAKCETLGLEMVPTVVRALAACMHAPGVADRGIAPVPPYAMLLGLLHRDIPQRFIIGDASAVVALLTAAHDEERKRGEYPATLASLGFVEALIDACPAELLVLPWRAHAAVPELGRLARGAADGVPTAGGSSSALSGVSQLPTEEPQAVETLGTFLDFSFGLCFARCSLWKCRSQVDRWQLALACIRIAVALLPAMECFNWSAPPALTTRGKGVSDHATTQAQKMLSSALAGLRALQCRVLRCWSEAALISTLVQLLSCDIGFNHPSGKGASHFIGFLSPALEDSFGATSSTVNTTAAEWVEPVTGSQVVVAALQCFQELLELVLRPTGAAPHYASLAQHLLEVSIAREPRSRLFGWLGAPGSSGEALAPVPHRADFVQSLYAYACARDALTARWAISVLASLAVLWSHVDLRQSPGDTGRPLTGHPASDLPRKPLLLAFLSIPPRPTDVVQSDIQGGALGASSTDASLPVLLSSHLARHVLGVIQDAAQDSALRCACANFTRVALVAQPGLFLDPDELKAQPGQPCQLPKLSREAAAAAGQALAGILGKAEASSGELLTLVLELLDNLTVVNSSLVAECFSASVGQDGAALPLAGLGSFGSSGGGSRSFPTMWHLLTALVSEVLRPWAQGGGKVWPASEESAVSSMQSFSPEPFLAIAAVFRLAERGCEAAEDIFKKSQEAHTAFVELLACLLGPGGLELWAGPARTQRAIDFTSGGTADFDMMSHPYGATGSAAEAWAPLKFLQEGRCSIDRFHGLLAKYHLRAELLSPAPGSTSVRHLASITEGERNVVAEIGLQQAFAGRNALLQSYGFSNLAGALTTAYGGRCNIPGAFRWWADLCELACGAAVDISSPSRGPLPLWMVQRAGEQAESLTSGTWSCDSQVDGASSHMHGPSVRLVAAYISAVHGESTSVMKDLVHLLSECKPLVNVQAGLSSRVVALEAFDALVGAASRQGHGGKTPQLANRVSELLTPLTLSVVHHLHCALEHLDLLADNAAFFSGLIRLTSRLLAMPPHVSALLSTSRVLTPFHSIGSLKIPETAHMATKLTPKLMLASETPLSLAVVRQLTSALQTTGSRLQMTEDLPPKSQALVTGVAFSNGHADVAYASVSLLMLLVPALRRANPQWTQGAGFRASENSFETSALLTELLQVVAGLLDCVAASEQREAMSKASVLSGEEGIGSVATMAVDDGSSATTTVGPAGGTQAPELAPSGLLADGRAPKVLLQSPEDAMTRCTDETQERALDHVLRSGLTGLLLALAERIVTALLDRECGALQGSVGSLGSHSLSVLQHALLPRILSCSCSVFSPNLDRHRLPLTLVAIGARPALTAPIWDRAVEAAWACQLDAVLSVLLTVAKSTAGAVLLAEQRVFSMLAYCQLLHAAVLPFDSSGEFPNAYAWPSTGHIYRKSQRAWRRPLHESWCRALLLVATLLSSAPQLASEAIVFLDQFSPRLNYLFRFGVQSGHMAMLEEAAMVCRILALISHRVGLAELLLADATSQAMVFLVGTCFAEISTASEVFMPVSVAERIGAQLAPEAEAAPAEVPSLFHQRVQYLSLDLVRSLMLALLRVTSSPTWLSNVASWASNPSWSSTAAPGPRGWPAAPSVLGLHPQVGNGVGLANREGNTMNGPQRLWSSVTEVSLEISRRMVSILEALRGHRAPLILVSGSSEHEGPWIPLSLAISVLEPHETDGFSSGSPSTVSSPSGLAKGLTPPPTPRNPGRLTPLLAPGSPSGGNAKRLQQHEAPTRRLRYRHMALRSDTWLGRQLTLGIIPEYTSQSEFRRLCSTILEMASTLVCHFCQATRGSISGGSDRSSPGSAARYGLISFFNELQGSQEGHEATHFRKLGIDDDVADYLMQLDSALRSGKDFGSDCAGREAGSDGGPSGPPNLSLDGESLDGPSGSFQAGFAAPSQPTAAGLSGSGFGFRTGSV